MSHKIKIFAAFVLFSLVSFANATESSHAVGQVYLQITLQISEKNRPAAVAVYQKYKSPFLSKIKGAQSKQLLVRAEDVQVLHGFNSLKAAQAYLNSKLFNTDVVTQLAPLLDQDPKVSIYKAL